MPVIPARFCLPYITIVKKSLAIIGLSLAVAIAPAMADIGSKYRDQHGGDRSKRSEKPQAEAFDFSKLKDSVGILHRSAIDEQMGGHVDQAQLEAMPALFAFVHAFTQGDELFEINYNALDGVGINVGNGQRFSSVPRIDLDGPAAWATILPHRITGPNGDSCISCHNIPVADGAGGVNDNVIRIDPERLQKGFIERQAPHIFGMGAVQLLAEEMTLELHALRDGAIEQSCASGSKVQLELASKAIEFGNITVACEHIDYRKLEGVDPDLVVKPFEWKGLTAFVRDFVRGASHQELGMQATELVGDQDSDYDGITNELTVGDVTALTVYNAAQPRPVSKLELNQISSHLNEDELALYGLPLNANDRQSINNGEQVFRQLQCTSCHAEKLTVATPVFSEPSRHPEFRDDIFPAGAQVSLPAVAIEFDLTTDIMDNGIALDSGQNLGQFERDASGGATVRLYGDLKRHNMGRSLAENIDEGNVGPATFLTENLWGIGSTPPYLHDGRATTLTEAILFHGGEANKSRNLFKAAREEDQHDLIKFLDNLVLYLAP